MTNGERYKIFKEWFDSMSLPEIHASYKDAMWQGFEAGHRKASKINDAAPELLEALQNCVYWLEVNSEPFSIEYEHVQDAKAAINKALGE